MPDRADGFRLGVNDWPSDVTMDRLRLYDPVVTRQDFRFTAAAGLDIVRVFVR